MPKRMKTLVDVYRNHERANRVGRDGTIPAVFSVPVDKPWMHQNTPRGHTAEPGTFCVPYGGDPSQLAERAYAYGELWAGKLKLVSYGLVQMRDLDSGWVRGIRRATGHALMTSAGVDFVKDRKVAGSFGDSVYGWARYALEAMGTAEGPAVLKNAKKFMRANGYKKQANILKSMLEGAVSTAVEKDDIVSYIRLMQELYGTAYQEPEKEKAPSKVDTIPDDPLPLPEPPAPRFDPSANWGQMEHIHVPLQHPKDKRKRSDYKRWKRAPVGAFRYPWRALKTSDLQCFGIKRRQFGGTLLLDLSGSMSVSTNQIKTILEHAPEATIAAYGSHPNTTAHGRLVIVAKNGLLASCGQVRKTIGGGNVVDGPALRWLAEQPGPRMWVGDGMVTGLNESQHPWLSADAQRIVRDARIQQIPSVAEVIRLLQPNQESTSGDQEDSEYYDDSEESDGDF